jgi:predicted nuclease of predicted toxin-antitoxin system
MKLLFDQNISLRILKKLPEIFYGSSHVKTEGLMNSPDLEIWQYARVHHFIIVTQDSDFNDLYLIKGFPPKILWFQTGNLQTAELALILKNRQNDLIDFSNNNELGCMEISRLKSVK